MMCQFEGSTTNPPAPQARSGDRITLKEITRPRHSVGHSQSYARLFYGRTEKALDLAEPYGVITSTCQLPVVKFTLLT